METGAFISARMKWRKQVVEAYLSILNVTINFDSLWWYRDCKMD